MKVPSRSGIGFVAAIPAIVLTAADLVAQQDRGSSTEKGSMFVLSAVELRWNSSDELIQDTFIKLSNDFPGSVDVQLYYVNGDEPLPEDLPERAHPGWNTLDATIALTANQPTWWSLNSGQPLGLPPFTALDPGVPPGRPDPEIPGERMLRGYIVGWAVDSDGDEIRWNHLAAEAVTVHYEDAMTWAHTATHYQVVSGVANGSAPDGVPGQINLDGVEYAPAADHLMMNFAADGGTLYSGLAAATVFSDLTLHPVSVDLRQETNGPVVTNAVFDIWNANEVKLTGSERCISCWDQQLLENYAPVNQFILANLGTDVGRARIDGVADPGCAGSVEASLLGVVRREIELPGTHDSAVFTLQGTGFQSAQVLYDPVGGVGEDPVIPIEREQLAPSVVLSNVAPPAAEASGPVPLPRVSADRPGSLFIVSEVELRYDFAQNLTQDTFVHLSNDSSEDVTVQLYFINGDEPVTCCGPPPLILEPGWNNVDAQITLTGNQPVYWSLGTGSPLGLPPFSVLDPAGGKQPPGRPDEDGGSENVLRGYIVGFAINDDGQEIQWNHLTADAITIHYNEQTARGCNAWQFQAASISGNGFPTGDPGTLNLDGVEYSQGFDQLMSSFQATDSFAYTSFPTGVQSDTKLTVHPATVDFRQESTGPVGVTAGFTIWNENEVQFTGTTYCVSCWDQQLLSSVSPPNNFTELNLQTSGGKFRLDAADDDICNPFEQASLLGVSTELLDFTTTVLLGAPGPAANQRNLIGLGLESAVIVHDGPALADLDLGAPNEFAAAGEGVSVASGHFDTQNLEPVGPIDSVVAIPDQNPAMPGQAQVFLNLGTDGMGNWLGYAAQTPITVGLDPQDVAVGRFNADAFDDIAVANAGDNTVTIYLNSADGMANFTLAETIGGLSEPRGIAAADLDGNGFDDIAVANATGNTVAIYTNAGTLPLNSGTSTLGGSFALVQIEPVGDRPVRVEPEDLDNDKDLDLVVASFNAGQVTVLQNNLNAPVVTLGLSFTALPPVDVGAGPVDVAAADLDNNTFGDFITADFFANQLSVGLNSGPLSFSSSFPIPVGIAPQAVDVADIDGDGDVDLVVAANDPAEGPSVQAIANLLVDTGGLAFSAPEAFPAGAMADPNALDIADVDQDGRPDVVTANESPAPSGGTVSALVNDFAPPCPADCSPPGGGNGVVTFDDIIAIVNAFSTQDLSCDIAPDNGDGTFGNGVVDIDDLMMVIMNVGGCPE